MFRPKVVHYRLVSDIQTDQFAAMRFLFHLSIHTHTHNKYMASKLFYHLFCFVYCLSGRISMFVFLFVFMHARGVNDSVVSPSFVRSSIMYVDLSIRV